MRSRPAAPCVWAMMLALMLMSVMTNMSKTEQQSSVQQLLQPNKHCFCNCNAGSGHGWNFRAVSRTDYSRM